MSRTVLYRIASCFGYLACAAALVLYAILRMELREGGHDDLGDLTAAFFAAAVLSLVSSVTRNPIFWFLACLVSFPFIFSWHSEGISKFLVLIPLLNFFAILTIAIGFFEEDTVVPGEGK